MHGEAVFAPNELQYSTFNLVKPLLEATEPYQRIRVSPLPCYLQGPCCNQIEHVSNLHDEDYKEVQEEAILACRCNLKDFAFRLGLKTRVICPWSQLRKLEDDLWPTNLVHMDKKGYAAVAGQILMALQHNSSMDMDQSKKGGGRDVSAGRGVGGNSRPGVTPTGGGWRPQRGRGRGGGTWQDRTQP